MRLAVGLVVLAVGGVALGWWARQEYAPFMQEVLQERADSAMAGSVHGATATVAGRDITASGLADGPAEHDRLIAALDGIDGRRVVNDDLQVLPLVSPFTLSGAWANGALAAQGHAPTEAARVALDRLGAHDLTLAAGAPDAQWVHAAMAGIAGVHELQSGRFEVSDRTLTLSGVALTPIEGQAAQAAVNAELPEGYQATLDLSYVDDGSPPRYDVHYTVESGPWVEGKLPRGVSAADVASALDLADIDTSATQALTGEPGQVSPVLARLASWLPEVETLDVTVAPDGTRVDAGFGAGADMDLLGTALAQSLQGAMDGVTLTMHPVTAEGANGTERINALSGRTEVLADGYWLPAVDFTPDAQSCASETTRVLGANRIGFVTGSARLDAHARAAVNALAGVLGPCLGQAGLKAEIGGHTDSTGSDEANMTLSLERAQAVRAALLARGVPADGLTAEGYGATQPVASNDTDAGRAANRRTAVRWIE
ncbi:MAG: OmpA family protein [Rhodobacteraceae bacterium]|nr:OmpA family protein [Paracoccaceae bacterium]